MLIKGRLPDREQILTAPRLFVGSVVLLAALGTLGLRVLPGLYTGEPLSWLDALFTATSAISVTGLTVVDTATRFTPLGQAYLLLLIQTGGLSIITFTTLIITALGIRPSLRHEAVVRTAVDIVPGIDHRRLTRDIILLTFAIEILGAVFLYLAWYDELGSIGAIWPAVFHSVSAFCNAGFSTFSDSLMGAGESGGVLFIVGSLVVLGGIGFPVMEELLLAVTAEGRKKRFRLSLHARLVLVSTVALVLLGWLVFASFEWEGAFKKLDPGYKLINALFMSISVRTAGFTTVDPATFADNTNFFSILLMAIGGSPGSTAGGLKTTTVMIIGLIAWCRLRGMNTVRFAGRSIPEETVHRAVGLFVIVFVMITAAVLVLATTERAMVAQGGSFLNVMFEAVSAFGTAGGTTGITTELSTPGRMLTVILMIIGRMGPLTLAAALAARATARDPWHYAYEDVGVG